MAEKKYTLYADISTETNSNSADYAHASYTPAFCDALITDVFLGVPRSAPFINKCLTEGKTLISQISNTDFDGAAGLKGIGISSAENLRRVFTEYTGNHMSSRIVPEKNEMPHMCSNPISCLPLSVRALNCLTEAGVSSLEELLSLSVEDLMSIKNMGVKTCQEILDFCETESPLALSAKLYYPENVAADNRHIPVSLLRNIGVIEQNIDILLENGYITVNDLCERGLTRREYSFIRMANKFLAVSVIDHFMAEIDSLKDSEKVSILRRCKGATLQEIGEEIGVTRERVRQILVKTCRTLANSAELIAGMLFSANKTYAFSLSALLQIFPTEQAAMCCSLVFQESDYVRYFKFSDKYVRSDICPDNVDQRLREYADEIIGEGTNFYVNLELIESELQKRGLDFFDFEDIMNYLVHIGYRFYGVYVTRGKQSYANVCYDAIRRFFAFDIKLDSDDNNEDMLKLRQIIAKNYQGLFLPPGNRALTAVITRNATKIVLSARGRYCPVEKAIYSISLLDEVCDFVRNSPQTTFYYSELFSRFQGRFLAETNIDNFHFLHGMLKCLYPNDFTYERDLLVKNGSVRQDIDARLSQLLLEQGHSMTKTEIKRRIPGINDFVIAFSVMRQPKIIQWEYDKFNHISNIHLTDEEQAVLKEAIKSQTDAHSGYTSDVLLYNAVKETCREFFDKNSIYNAQNLYYIASCILGEDYRFRRPHIVTKDFPVQELSVANIARFMLKCEMSLNHEQYYRLAQELGWAGGTLYSVFYELGRDFIRISENDYIQKDYFSVSPEILNSLAELLGGLISARGYYAFSSIPDYEMFPAFTYKWNSFLLESVIAEYNTGFRVIAPQVRDRRYQRGIIVSNDSPYTLFEDLVVGILRSDGMIKLSEAELLKYLKMNGLVTNAIPQELYECSGLPFKNEVFTVMD